MHKAVPKPKLKPIVLSADTGGADLSNPTEQI
jgi:hypothetical protein